MTSDRSLPVAVAAERTGAVGVRRVDGMRAACGWALLSMAVASCSRTASTPDATAEPTVTVSVAERGPVSDLLLVSGTLEPLPGKSARLGVLVPGRLAELSVAEGDAVHRGQVLARLESTPFRDSRAQAEATLQQAQAQALNARQHLARAEDLWDAGAGPRKDVEDAQAQLASADSAVRSGAAGVSLAVNQSTRGELVAPMDGVVAHLYAAVGEPMDGTGKPILEIAQVDVLELHGGASPRHAMQVSPGQPAEVVISGGLRREAGIVRAVSPAVDPASGLVRVRVQVANPDSRLKVGETAEARIVLRLSEEGIRVPLGALIAAGPGSTESSVNVLAADGHLHRQPVTVGVRDGLYAEILTGLSPGDRVVVSGSYSLPDGTAVRVLDGGTRVEKPE